VPIVERIANRMREKIAQTQTSGHTASYPRMRRYMSSHFEFHDKENTGLVNDAALRACLQRLGFALSPQHRALLFQQFGRPGYNHIVVHIHYQYRS
jgi:Ca2+-binding EF-hand superfamily protein